MHCSHADKVTLLTLTKQQDCATRRCIRTIWVFREGTSRCLRAGGERIPWKGRACRSPRGAERSRASSQRSEEHIQNLSLVICSPRLSRGEASRRSFLFWCRLFLERREGWGSVFLGEKFLFKLRSREIEKSLVGFTRVRIWFVV